jgi:acyl-CoA hydrolase
MSKQLISRSADLKRLQDEGYELEIRGSHLLVHHVPYVTPERQVAFGTLVSTLQLGGEITVRPDQHEAYFCGLSPCDSQGIPLEKIINNSAHQQLAPDLEVDHFFSSKPANGDGHYADYWDKMGSYIAILASPAQEIDPTATAQTYPLIAEEDAENGEGDSVFIFRDTASSRAGIEALTERLKVGPVAIVGLGGTGSYILDLLSKTPITEIHLFDGDRFAQHNAFRAPGAATREELEAAPQKVAYLRERYSSMHRRIEAHNYYLDESNVAELAGMVFVFVAMDEPEAKRPIVEQLERSGVPFIDVGMGIDEVDGSLRGLVRVTTATSAKRDHLSSRISLEGAAGADDYHQDIQIAELNSLNAALAVIRFKKHLGFYGDDVAEHNSTYVLSESLLISEDLA